MSQLLSIDNTPNPNLGGTDAAPVTADATAAPAATAATADSCLHTFPHASYGIGANPNTGEGGGGGGGGGRGGLKSVSDVDRDVLAGLGFGGWGLDF